MVQLKKKILSLVNFVMYILPQLKKKLNKRVLDISKYSQLLHISKFCTQRLNQLQIKNIPKKKKIPESSKKQSLNLLPAGNYLHSIYIILGIISNLEMI